MSPRTKRFFKQSADWTRLWWLRTMLWFLNVVSDEHGLSLNKFIAVFICFVIWHDTVIHEHGLTGATNWALVIAGSLAFGKYVWIAFLNRNQFTSTNAVTTEIKADIAKILEARKGLEYQPSP